MSCRSRLKKGSYKGKIKVEIDLKLSYFLNENKKISRWFCSYYIQTYIPEL